jgi:hypothetical protein
MAAAAILERLPAWATTGVGSLPHDDPAAAAAHAVAAYELPFLPQLPRVEGDMVREWLGADPARCGWSPARDRERPPAWEALLAWLARTPPPHGVVKLQVTGPVTLARALDAPELAGDLARWLATNVAGQVRALRERGLDALLVVDEPALASAAGVAETVWDPLRGAAPAWGLHLCCAVPWELVRAARPDLLSLDLLLPGALSGPALPALRELLARGGRVAWGVLPATPPVPPEPHAPPVPPRAALDGARAGLHALGVDLDQLARRSLLTPSCGTGLATVAHERQTAATLHVTAAALRPEPDLGSAVRP